MTDEFEVPIPDTIKGETQEAGPGRPKTVWPVFPPWGNRGHLIEFRPPSQYNNYPYVMFQAIDRFNDTFKKTRKKFNPKQVETGMYTPTVSIAFSALPIIINALNELWETWRDSCVEPPGDNPNPDTGLEDYRKAVRVSQEDTAVSSMGEFGGKPGRKSAPPSAPDIWDTLKQESAAAKNAANQAAPISEGEGESDDYGGLGAEFGGGGKRGPVPF